MEPSRFILHPFQASAIASLRSTQMHLALTAPTGAGKGVILERLAENPDERILLLTPLIALGRQQTARFQRNGIPTRISLGGEKISPAVKPRVWISSPEAALTPRRLEKIRQWNPTLVAVDEAHCISEWGESFRPAYRKIIPFIQDLGMKRTLWMSATFPRATIKELKTALPGKWRVEGTFRIPANLKTSEHRVGSADRIEIIRRHVLARSGAGILFAGTRKNVERYCALFEHEGRSFLPYHAGMSDEERRGVEKRLERELKEFSKHSSIAATNAFGMGMDYPHLEWVAMAGIPYSLLSLMQSYGRVGRSGKAGNAALYWSEEDFRFAGYFATAPESGQKSAKDLSDLRDYLESTESEREGILRKLFL